MFPAISATTYQRLRGILSRGSELYSSYFLLPEKILFHYAMAENIVVYTSWQAELLQVGFRHPIGGPHPVQNHFIQATLANVMLSGI